MAVLLIGGTGKTGLHLAKKLGDANIPFLLTSRKGEAGAPAGIPATEFDWLRKDTYDTPFQYTFPDNEKIKAIYLIAPDGTGEPAEFLNPFIDLARQKHGVNRFVLLTGTIYGKGDPDVGKVWQHLDDIGTEYSVLRATWFMDNFAQWEHLNTIRKESKIYTSCGDGKTPFISTADIAAVAFRCLTDAGAPLNDIFVFGAELLTHDDVAEKLSEALGRKITHVRLTEEETLKRYQSLGMSEADAKFMTWLETNTAAGAEERMDDAVERITGRLPMTFDTWAEANKKCWESD
ncbi:hypothetical protein B0H19DRAFT_1149970 [Mycena capillaripes]|nr:hypothetical protein B0H19DRAFT_1149970 [Mycena capillaripes]